MAINVGLRSRETEHWLSLRSHQAGATHGFASADVNQSSTDSTSFWPTTVHFAGLFLPDGNLWLNVLTDSAYAGAQAKSPTTQKVRVSNYRDFAKLVTSTTKSFDREHSNFVIHTDGTIAVLYFDFVFNVDGKVNNQGSETWQLVKAADGWRIASIVYSSEPPAQQ